MRRERAREARAAAAPAAVSAEQVLPAQKPAEPQQLETGAFGCVMALSVLVGLVCVVFSLLPPGTVLVPEWLREWGARARTPNAGVRVRDVDLDLAAGLLMIAFGGIGLLRQRYASRCNRRGQA